MANFIQGNQLRRLVMGHRVAATNYSLVTETHTLFNINNGAVAITSLYGNVTTTITVANTVKLQTNPTVGATGNLVTATDIGTTDTPAGDFLGISGVVGDSIIPSVGWAVAGFKQPYLIVAAGTIEQVTTGTSPDGAITWVLTYVPIDSGASVTAA